MSLYTDTHIGSSNISNHNEHNLTGNRIDNPNLPVIIITNNGGNGNAHASDCGNDGDYGYCRYDDGRYDYYDCGVDYYNYGYSHYDCD